MINNISDKLFGEVKESFDTLSKKTVEINGAILTILVAATNAFYSENAANFSPGMSAQLKNAITDGTIALEHGLVGLDFKN
jgi:hypothetical protein